MIVLLGCRLVTALLLALLLTGCATASKPPTPKQVGETYKVMHGGLRAAGGAEPYIGAGLYHVDVNCDAFFEGVAQLERRTSMGQDAVRLFGGTTAGVLAATQSAAKAIAITALMFAGVENQIDIYKEYELLGPFGASARDLVERSRQAYRAQTWPTDEMEAVAFVQGYARLCTIATIQTHINDAVRKAPVSLQEAPELKLSAEERQNLVLAFPSIDLAGRTDQEWARLYWFLTDGMADPATQHQFKTEFPGLFGSLTQLTDAKAELTSTATQLSRQLGGLKVSSRTFGRLVQALSDARARAVAERDEEVRNARQEKRESPPPVGLPRTAPTGGPARVVVG